MFVNKVDLFLKITYNIFVGYCEEALVVEEIREELDLEFEGVTKEEIAEIESVLDEYAECMRMLS